mgnify:CR=1 FL=1
MLILTYSNLGTKRAVSTYKSHVSFHPRGLMNYSIRRISYYSFLIDSFDGHGYLHLVPLVLTLTQ